MAVFESSREFDMSFTDSFVRAEIATSPLAPRNDESSAYGFARKDGEESAGSSANGHNDVSHPPDFDTFCRNTVITGCWSLAPDFDTFFVERL